MTKRSKYLPIDLNSDVIRQALQSAPIFKKSRRVRARIADPGEIVVSKIGSKEYLAYAKPGDWIISNLSGKRELVPGTEFFKLYERTGDPNLFALKGRVRAVLNPIQVPIKTSNRSGKPQRGEADCVVVVECDLSGDFSKEPTLVCSNVFNNTYRLNVEDPKLEPVF